MTIPIGKALVGRRAVLATGLAAGAAATLPARARAQQRPIRIGVLTDMSGVYAANTGPGSVLGAQLAIEDFSRAHPAIKVELVQADLQLKPDVALAIAADWYDNQGVDLITDVPLSSAAFAIGDLAKQKDKVAIFTGAPRPTSPARIAVPTICTGSTTPGRCRTAWWTRR